MCINQFSIPFSSLLVLPSFPSPLTRAIHHLLSLSFAHSGSESDIDLKDCYLLLMNRDSVSSFIPWHGKTIKVRLSTETTIAISEIEVSEHGETVCPISRLSSLSFSLSPGGRDEDGGE